MQLRVDGVLIRLRDTRMHCVFGGSTNPVILRESCWRESTFQALSAVSLLHASLAMFFKYIRNGIKSKKKVGGCLSTALYMLVSVS